MRVYGVAVSVNENDAVTDLVVVWARVLQLNNGPIALSFISSPYLFGKTILQNLRRLCGPYECRQGCGAP